MVRAVTSLTLTFDHREAGQRAAGDGFARPFLHAGMNSFGIDAADVVDEQKSFSTSGSPCRLVIGDSFTTPYWPLPPDWRTCL